MASPFIQSPLKRIFFYIFSLSVILLLALELILRYNVPTIKDAILYELEVAMDRRVTIHKMEMGLFRGIRAEDIKIYDKGLRPVVRINELSIKFRPLPLLWRKAVVTDVSIIDPEIIITRGSNGMKLLEDVYSLKGKRRVSLSPFGKRRIKRGTVTIVDNAQELKLADNINALIETDYFHGASRLRLNGRLSYPESLPFVNPVIRKWARSLKGDFALDVYIESKSNGELKCYGEVDTNETEGHVYLITKINSQDIRLAILHIRVGDFLVRSHGNIYDWMSLPDFAIQSEFTNLPTSILNNLLPDIALDGFARGSLEIDGPKNNLRFASEVELKDNTLRYKNDSTGISIDNISGYIRWTGDSIEILELTGSRMNSRINITGKIDGLPEPNIRLNITCDNVQDIISMPPEMKLEGENSLYMDIKGDFKSTGISGMINLDKSSIIYQNLLSKPRDYKLRINTIATLSRGFLKIEKIDLIADSSIIEILGEIRDFKHPRPNLKIRIDEARLAELKKVIPFLRDMTLSGSGVGVEMNISGEETATDGMVMKGKANIIDLDLNKVKIRDLNASLEFSNNEFKAEDIKGEFCKGIINGSMAVFFKEQTIHYSSNIAISGVDMEELLKGVSSTSYKADGKISGKVYFHGEGSGLKSLKGEGSIEVKNGRTSGLPFLKALTDITNISSFTQFDFESASFDFKLNGELLTIENLIINGRDANFYISKAQIKLNGSITEGTLSAEFPRHVLAKSNKFSLLLFLLGEKSSKIIFDYKLSGFIDNPRLQWMESKLKERIENILTLGQKKSIEAEIKQAIEALIEPFPLSR